MESKDNYRSPLEDAYLSLRKRLDLIGKNFSVTANEAEDIIQEGYLRLIDKNFSNEAEAKGSFWVTIRNLCVDRFRKSKKIECIKESDLDVIEDFHYDLEYRLLREQIQQILSPLQNKIMTMLIEDDLDYPEIAEKLNMKESAVRTNICRARKLLKKNMNL